MQESSEIDMNPPDRPPMTRRRTRAVSVGDIQIGGGAPIVVQSMTNTDTADIAATVAQVKALADAGSELVRITVNTAEAAAAVPAIRERLDAADCKVPLIGDFHFNGHKLLSNFPDCARALAKYRINPGNVGKGARHDPQFAVMIERAIDYGKPVRIGVNWGSLDQDLLASLMDENARSANPLDAASVMREALMTSAIRSAQFAEALGLPGDRIILACKVSNVQDLIAVYTELARRCDYPLHSVSPKPAWAARASWRRRRRSPCCCSKASATRSASPSRRSPTATGRAR